MFHTVWMHVGHHHDLFGQELRYEHQHRLETSSLSVFVAGILVATGEEFTSSFALSGSGTSFTVTVNTSRCSSKERRAEGS